MTENYHLSSWHVIQTHKTTEAAVTCSSGHWTSIFTCPRAKFTCPRVIGPGSSLPCYNVHIKCNKQCDKKKMINLSVHVIARTAVCTHFIRLFPCSAYDWWSKNCYGKIVSLLKKYMFSQTLGKGVCVGSLADQMWCERIHHVIIHPAIGHNERTDNDQCRKTSANFQGFEKVMHQVIVIISTVKCHGQ